MDFGKKKIKKIQVSAAAGNKSNEKLSVKRMVAPFQPVPVQKTAVVKVQDMFEIISFKIRLLNKGF